MTTVQDDDASPMKAVAIHLDAALALADLCGEHLLAARISEALDALDHVERRDGARGD